MIRIENIGNHGLYLPDLDVGLDSGKQGVAHTFISHAHADHVPASRFLPVITTPPTAALMRVRGFKGEISELEFYHSYETDHFRATFYPAGHILGSAMTYIESKFGNILYTGDYRTPPSPASEGFDHPAQVDVFITEATFSLPIYRWKPHEAIFDEIRTFALDAIDKKSVPVFVTYTLGKAQEVMMALQPLDIPMQLHDGAIGLSKVYEQFGFNLGTYGPIRPDDIDNTILIVPMPYLSSPTMQKVRDKRIAYCSGWSELANKQVQSSADALITLSDHLDFFELIALCKKIQPRHVVITHTPNPDVVSHYLSREGIASSTGLPVNIEL